MAISARGRATEATALPSRRRRLASRLSAGHLVMIVAGLIGMLLTLALLRNADERVEVAVAAHDLRTGDVVGTGDVSYERVKMDGDLLGTVFRRDDVGRLDGAIAVQAVGAGELISRTAVRPAAAPSELRAVSIPIDRARAVNGQLVPGDRVDVLLAAEAEVAVVVAGAEVLDVSDPAGGTALSPIHVDRRPGAHGSSGREQGAASQGPIILAQERGGQIVRDILEDLVATTTRDLKVQEEIETEGLEMKINARVVLVLPWIVLVALTIRAGPFRDFYQSGGGLVVVALGGALSVVGYVVISRLGRSQYERRVFGAGAHVVAPE